MPTDGASPAEAPSDLWRRFDRIEAQVQHAAANWRGLLTGSVADGRQLLREVLEAPLQFTPEGKVYRISGPVAVGRVIAGAVGQDYVASPTGSGRLWTGGIRRLVQLGA